MKQIILTLLIASLVGCSASTRDEHTGHGDKGKSHTPHGEHAQHADAGPGYHLMVTTEPREPRLGQPVTLRLMIHGPGGAMVKDFETVHEAKVHLIIVREGLDHFAHIHPEVDERGNLTATFTFPTGGLYRLYADYKPAGKAQAVASAEVKVAGPSSPAPPLAPDVPGKVKGDGLDAEVTVTSAPAASATGLTFRLLDPTGQPVSDLQPYLGAMGHLVILSGDTQEYVHAHPSGKEATAGSIAFEAHFARPGIYKGWAQFRRGGKIHTVPLVVRIEREHS